MKTRFLVTASICAAAGAAVATLLLPATAEVTGENAGVVRIGPPAVQPAGSSTFLVRPHFVPTGNIEVANSSVTAKKGSTVVTGSQISLAKGTYSITTKVRYRYMKFYDAAPQIITKGEILAENPAGNEENGGSQTGVKVRDCVITASTPDIGDATKGTFEGSCQLDYVQVSLDPDSNSDEPVIDKTTPLGAMTGITGTYSDGGATAYLQGDPTATTVLSPGRAVGGSFTSDHLRATKNYSGAGLGFYVASPGAYQLATRTQTVKVQ